MQTNNAYINQLGKQASSAAKIICSASTKVKNQALLAIANSITAATETILAANAKDITSAQNKLDTAMLDRLKITSSTVQAMTTSIHQIAQLKDPVGDITNLTYQTSGIQVGKMRVSLGVIGIIYESRPNVTCEAAALCIKSGNAVILRGGSEAMHTNQAIYNCIQQGLNQAHLTADIVQIINTTDREAVTCLIKMKKYVNVIIPRGGKSLVKLIDTHASVPVIKHLDGICHVYIDKDAKHNKAINIAINSKTQRYGVCNAMETLLIHTAIAPQILPILVEKYTRLNVVLKGCVATCKIIPHLEEATEEDWTTEYLAPILSIRIVENANIAIDHINHYGSHHTDVIVTDNLSTTNNFLRMVDSSSVMVNASTRFADGFEYGLGAEIGISTDKIHVRGPVGLEGLTCEKYIVIGEGQVR